MASKSHKVTFLIPAGNPMVVDARDGDSILDTALNHDVPLQHACGGFCACTTCHVHVKEGAQNLSKLEGEEEDRMVDLSGHVPASRLGCQARVRGNVTVEIVNVDGGL